MLKCFLLTRTVKYLTYYSDAGVQQKANFQSCPRSQIPINAKFSPVFTITNLLCLADKLISVHHLVIL